MLKSRFIFILSMILLCGALFASADTITFTATTGGTTTAVSYWNQQTLALSSTVASESQTGGQTTVSTPFSFVIPYTLPTDITINSASLFFNAATSENGPGIQRYWNAVNAGYWYTAYCNGHPCGNHFWYYNYAPGSMSTSGVEQALVNGIDFGSIHSNLFVPTSSGGFDLMALGFGSALLNGDTLTLDGTASQFQSNAFALPGYNASTNFTNTTSGIYGVTGTLSIDYTRNPVNDSPPVSTPEPASLFLLGSGLLAISGAIGRKLK